MSEDKELFIRFCGQLVFGEGISSWDQLPKDQQERFCALAQQAHWDKLFLRKLGNRLPAAFFQDFRKSCQMEILRRLIESDQLKALYHLLEKEKIPFVPIKGADMAFRIFPDPVLRPHGDWDILFHKADCPRVLALLQKQNWQTFSGCSQEKNPDNHHYEPMHNQFFSIEVHWTLPGFDKAAVEEIWKETIPLNDYHRVLTPEMNLLLISAHAGIEFYTHVAEWKILMDAGYILQHDPIDWHKVHQLADHWEILRPDILLSIWNEFFPAGTLPAECLNPAHQQLLREIFSSRAEIANIPLYEKKMNILGQHNLNWLMEKLRICFCPRTICLKYHIQPDSRIKLLFWSCFDLCKKGFYLLGHFRSKNPFLQRYYQNVKAVEKLIKHKK